MLSSNNQDRTQKIPAFRPENSFASRLHKTRWEFLLKPSSPDLQSFCKELWHQLGRTGATPTVCYEIACSSRNRVKDHKTSQHRVGMLIAMGSVVLTEFSSLQHSQWHLWKAQFCHSVRKAWQEVWLLPVSLCKLHPKCVQLMQKQAEQWKERKSLRDHYSTSIIPFSSP